ncbi:Hypothetical protein ZOBELLIA_3500 [Zobellia galactanivorans]|uniref:Uncharacterized protein n=1 Tax=Zobellia galactanivorans (strain DSM 12802 / CCUG 47099 / CIP 106680 / NCIMB 13871 / Dsij) TaxID=63186 RepID=G0L8K3_ZOBGA|nr:Hypothetical protein ZOBELLIA_3500 [Zobellia galactanivorans]
MPKDSIPYVFFLDYRLISFTVLPINVRVGCYLKKHKVPFAYILCFHFILIKPKITAKSFFRRAPSIKVKLPVSIVLSIFNPVNSNISESTVKCTDFVSEGLMIIF